MKAEIKWGGNILYGNSPNMIITGTTKTVPLELQLNNRLMNLFGLKRCRPCNGEGWDANSGGGVYICPDCEGCGVIKIIKEEGGYQALINSFLRFVFCFKYPVLRNLTRVEGEEK